MLPSVTRLHDMNSSFGSCRHTARRRRPGRGADKIPVKRSGVCKLWSFCLQATFLLLGACCDLGGNCMQGPAIQQQKDCKYHRRLGLLLAAPCAAAWSTERMCSRCKGAASEAGTVPVVRALDLSAAGPVSKAGCVTLHFRRLLTCPVHCAQQGQHISTCACIRFVKAAVAVACMPARVLSGQVQEEMKAELITVQHNACAGLCRDGQAQ